MTMKHISSWLALAAILIGTSNVSAQILFEENFDSLLGSLGPSVNERIGTSLREALVTDPSSSPVPGVWSATAPGWTVDNTLATYDGSPTISAGVPGVGLPDSGVDEWEGWGFADIAFWAASDDQDRSMFGTASGASGTAAIADADEYFDIGDLMNDPTIGGYYNTALESPSFPVAAGNFYGVGFASSWRDEAFDDSALGDTFVDQNNQSVEVIAVFDNGSEVQVTKWNSDGSDAFFKDDAPDELFPSDGSNLLIEAPAGATSAKLSFRVANAGNDWWWAVDNIQVEDLTGGAGVVLSEDFEGVALGDSVNERLVSAGKVTASPADVTEILGVEYPTQARPDSYTHTGPAGWSVSNDGTPGVGDDNVGVFELEQWSFMTPDFFTFIDQSGREDFANGTGVIAVADGDEWDDLGDPDASGPLQTMMETPSIDISGVPAGTPVVLEFDSSWRAEDSQTAVITALIDGTEVEVLRWESDSTSSSFHGDNVNESVAVMIDTAGASALQLQFAYSGSNDWWWAVDNVKVSVGIPEPTSLMMLIVAGCGLLAGARRQR